jgi:hypothetical protein
MAQHPWMCRSSCLEAVEKEVAPGQTPVEIHDEVELGRLSRIHQLYADVQIKG